MSDFANYSDDFYVNLDLHTALPLPSQRETVLSFCEAVQKQFPDLTDFYQRENGPHVLEGDRSAGSYRWMEMEARRLSAGIFNPPSLQAAYDQHRWLMDRSRFYLGISHLDVESLDLIYGFNLEYVGNRDAIVCEALLGGSPLSALLSDGNTMALSYEPTLVIALDPLCNLQARLAIETRNSSYQVRTGNYEEEPISVYFTVRAYPQPAEKFDMIASLAQQAEVGEDLVARIVIPQIVQPIASAIAAAQ